MPSKISSKSVPLSPVQKIAWAIDPFAGNAAADVRTGAVLRALTAKNHAVIQPTFVAGLEAFGIVPREIDDGNDPWNREVRSRIQSIAKRAKLKDTLTPKILAHVGTSVRMAAAELVRHAEKTGCDLIAVGTHGRTGAARLFLGSFAETLLLESTIPVLVVNPRVQETRAIRDVLFATDFSDRSRDAYPWVRRFVGALGARFHVFHRTLLDREESSTPYAPPTVSDDLWMQLQEERERTAEQWLQQALADDLPAQLRISRSRKAVPEAISAAAKTAKAGLVIVVSHSGALAATFLGSVARQLVRDASCPVLVVPPKFAVAK